ncbi:MAG: PAS domain-containing hybrid sensor histidine kinase/response regulator [Chthoniobacterales bacterium]
MAGKTKQQTSGPSPDRERAHLQEQTAAMNERLILSSVRQHELTEKAQQLNAQLQAEIIDRQLAEDALRESEERLRFMAESMPQKIFTAKPNGEIDYFNRQWMEFTGLAFEQIRDWGWLQFIHLDDVEENVRRWKHSIETGEYFELEHRCRRHDGLYRWHLSRAHAMRDAEGTVLMWIGSNTDIDDRKQAEEALRVAMLDCEKASSAKDDFLAALSHELRTPLTPVLLTATALEVDPALPLELRNQLAMMRRNIELEARLIDDLLDLTRISRGKLQIRPAFADLHQLLEQTAEMVHSDGLGKEVRIVFALEAARHHTMGDPSRLQQVFWNIIKNALKFTPAGGSVTVSTRNDVAGRIIISVTDTGIGIRPEALLQIFEAFEQGEITFQQRFGGLGLGLAISRAIVELHGGEIHAESAGVDHGSTFTVKLATIDAPRLAGPAETTAPPLERALRLLVVEDHEATLAVLSRLLKRSGHHLTSASSLREGLAAAAVETFDAVISDLGLPDGTGFELMEKLHANYGLRGIALSGYGMDEDLRRAQEAGFAAHLTKPIEFAQLERALEDLMAPASPVLG